MIAVRMARYSVPAYLIGRRVRVSLRASELVVFDGREQVARYERVITRGGASVQLDHYLEVFTTKPGALPGSSALAAARQASTFTTAHDAFWAASRKVNGDTAGTRELVDVLLLHRSMNPEQVIDGIDAALSVGAVTADVVAVEARRHTNGAMGGANADLHSAPERRAQPQRDEHHDDHLNELRDETWDHRRVINLTQRRLTDPAAVIAGLPPDLRPVPSVTAYNELLPRRQALSGVDDDQRESAPASGT